MDHNGNRVRQQLPHGHIVRLPGRDAESDLRRHGSCRRLGQRNFADRGDALALFRRSRSLCQESRYEADLPGVSYIFNFTCLTPSGMANNTASDLAVCSDTGVQVSWTDPSDWGDGGSGTRTFDVLRNGSPIQTGISSATHAYTDTTGINRTSYTYSVRANNGCGQSSSTAGASASDGVAPGAPVIGTITDSSGSCAYGISIPFTGGSGASSHNLYVDGSLALSGVTSPVSYTPADTNSRSYVIRAISGSCYTNSSASSFADTNNTPGQPSIGTITDSSGSCAYGISIPFTAGSGALRHDLYVDGSSWQTGVTSPASCTPADSNSHSYMIRAVNGTLLHEFIGGGIRRRGIRLPRPLALRPPWMSTAARHRASPSHGLRRRGPRRTTCWWTA